jgi:hypothetical protein
MAGRRRRAAQVPAGESAIAGANIRILRQRKGWSQAQLGELMGWPTTSTVCAAEPPTKCDGSALSSAFHQGS